MPLRACPGPSGETADPLTTREREVLKLFAEGMSSKEIARLLCISHRTVERHRSNMMVKLGVSKARTLSGTPSARGTIDAGRAGANLRSQPDSGPRRFISKFHFQIS